MVRAVKLGEIDDVLVTLSHPWVDGELSLKTWIEVGPGPRSLARSSDRCSESSVRMRVAAFRGSVPLSEFVDVEIARAVRAGA